MSSTKNERRSVVIDLTDKLALSPDAAFLFQNDLNARASLWEGLELLYQQTRQLEQLLVPGKLEGVTSYVWGNIPGAPLQVLRRASCFFDWYSVSACNFVSLTGWIAKSAGIAAETESVYRRRVIPLVLVHRNKIGAHTSRVWPHGDGIATQESSNFRQLALADDRLVANYMVLSRSGGGQSSSSHALEPWSLTETHETLRHRYIADPVA